MEEQMLVTRAQRGDPDAFAQLVERYQTPVHNLVYRMLGNPNDAEDAAQETFLRAYARLKSFRAGENFATWLLAIAAHYCIDRLRRRRFQWLSFEDDPALDESPASDIMVDDDLLRREQEHEIEMLLTRLNPASRLVIVLRYWYDMSIKEIARTTGDSVSAIKVRLHRARNQLAHELSNGENPHAVPGARAVRAF